MKHNEDSTFYQGAVEAMNELQLELQSMTPEQKEGARKVQANLKKFKNRSGYRNWASLFFEQKF
jgi:soluble cytochrome b562